ncbi:MAG: diaminopimelate decarboxylase [Oscillospiraceae bacterium]|jgi:diaminopimelate decarboxylase|nr:diaminopimelate decarboxylase [Oscillospiraceae bacterium]
MFVSDCLGVNGAGHLTIGGCDTLDLAAQYGTPLYVVDETQLRQNCRAYVRSLAHFYGGNGLALFASKAFCCKEVIRIMAQEGMGLEVCSGGELVTALSVGFPVERIYFHGNNKTPAELEMAVRHDVGHVVADNLEELRRLDAEAVRQGKRVKILLRVKPGIDAHTHNFIRTGQIDSKFGFALETGEAMAAAKAAAASANLELCGVHCHIGSQIFDVSPFELAAEVMFGFMAQIKAECGVELRELDLGGGFGVQYDQSDTPRPYAEYMEAVAKTLAAKAEEHGLAIPFILLEPGRSIPASAGITLYTVGAVKEIPGVRRYVLTDGGMNDNPRYILYGAHYTVLNAGRAGEEAGETYTIAGRCCETGDLIQEYTKVQPTQTGDVLAVLATGAYNYSMSLNYNRIPRPPVVMVREGEARVIIKAETFEDICRNDM